MAAIEEYCAKEIEIDPDYKYDGGFHQDRPDGSGISGKVFGNIVVRMKAQFLAKEDQDKMGCPAPKRFKMKKRECVRKLLSIIDDCKAPKSATAVEY